MDHVK